MFESAVSIVAVIFLLVGAGYFCQLKGWLGANAQTVLSRAVLRVGMPGLIFSNILGSYDRAMLLAGAYGLVAPIVVLTAQYLLSALAVRLARIPPRRRGGFRALFTFGNSLFMGLPVCRAVFGESAVPAVLLYYLVNTFFWWLIGAPAVARDGGADARGPLRRLASPPLVACLISVTFVFLGVVPPGIVMTTASYLGAMVTPLSMIFVGCTLCSMLSHGLRWQKGYGAMLLSRCLLGPALSLPLCLLMGLPAQTLGVFFLQSGMPAQTQSCLWAQENGADAEYVAGGIALSTLAGLLAIPFYAWILSLP